MDLSCPYLVLHHLPKSVNIFKTINIVIENKSESAENLKSKSTLEKSNKNMSKNKK